MKVRKESEDFDDIMLGDFRDSPLNLTLKTIMEYKWLNEHCMLDFGFVKSEFLKI